MAPVAVFLSPLLSAASGVLAHVAVFRRGEWDISSPSIFVFYATVFTAAAVASHVDLIALPLAAVAQIAAYHVVALYTSMLVYRGFCHRLAGYPGPFLARLTTFYITARSMKKMHLFEEVQTLHAQYGDYVRVGPRELSIADPNAVKALYSSQSPVTKGPWYTLLEPRVPLFMARDKQEHARPIQGYDPRITKAINQLLEAVDRSKGVPFDVSQWFSYFVFDVMEDLAFNKSSNMLAEGKEAYVFKTIRTDMFNIALFTHMPWLLPFLKRTPVLNWSYHEFLGWIQKLVDERKKMEPEHPDIFSWILEAFEKSPKSKRDHLNLHGDAQLIVIAGSDSVAAALTHIFFHLAWDPVLTKRLQTEFDALPDISHDNLMTVPLLDAVINETMRLHPPVPSGTQRVTPSEGMWIGENFIPGDTIVQVPSYTLFRDSRAFQYPNEFIPERWTSRPELVLDKSVYIPFNAGRYACVGKRLAMLELRRVVGEILLRYDLTIAPGQTKQAFLDGKQDTFTTVSASLPIIFTERAEVV
ncbi:cytochrome P450 monooxygenase [Dichotomopilus funicola]|uniref:Cytochrome P450 monooxygenase n=1 Tax=Dichotomopilus funicola TaxID=1934379 RepID=A0AAN6V9N4_9PEZI|nr:cytochrome P450 monooxygenase [Dichotomopilus funicola]